MKKENRLASWNDGKHIPLSWQVPENNMGTLQGNRVEMVASDGWFNPASCKVSVGRSMYMPMVKEGLG
jgi:hypothetical protein